MFPRAYFILYFNEDSREQITLSPIAHFVEKNNATVIWLNAPSTRAFRQTLAATGYHYSAFFANQHTRCANDFLYRAQTFSEWAFPTLDYDEYIAPTAPAQIRPWSPFTRDQLMPNDGWHPDVSLGNSELFTMERSLSLAPANVSEVRLSKWSAALPSAKVRFA